MNKCTQYCLLVFQCLLCTFCTCKLTWSNKPSGNRRTGRQNSAFVRRIPVQLVAKRQSQNHQRGRRVFSRMYINPRIGKRSPYYVEAVKTTVDLHRDCESPNPCLWNSDNAIVRIIHQSVVGQHGLKFVSTITRNRSCQIGRGSGIKSRGVYKT